MPGPVSTGMGDQLTGPGFNSQRRKPLSVYNYQPPRSTQPGHPLWVGAMDTSQTAVMLCGWGVKPGTVRVWVAGKTV